MNRAIASAISRSRAARPMRCANGATCASTNAAASSGQPERLASAIRRGPPRLQVTGLHPRPDPREAVLQLHRRRDQCPSAVGGAADREGELGDAELRHQRSTLDRPRVRPVSPPGVIQVAASSIDSGGCCSAQVTAASHQDRRAACIAAALASRATRSTSAEESRSSRSMLVVAVMSEFKHRAPTETGRDFACCGREFSTFFTPARWFRSASRRAVFGLV